MLSKEEIDALPDGTPVWLVATRHLEGQDAWCTTAAPALPRLLAYGEWAAFLTRDEARLWHARGLAAWARSEAKRLIKVARAAEKLAEKLAKNKPGCEVAGLTTEVAR